MRTSLAALLVLAALPARAQEPPKDWVPEEEDVQKKAIEEAKAEEPKPDGWFPKLSIGSNLSFSNNRNVVGSEEGTTITAGLLLDGGLLMRDGQHEWENSLAIRYQQTRTPLIDRFVKSMDQTELQSIYYYHLASVPWFGPFGRFRLQTQLFPSELVKGSDVQVVSTDGEVLADPLEARDSFDLAKSFEPLVLRETAGAFAKPYDEKAIKLLFKLGAGAQEIFARDGYVVADDDKTDPIEVRPLENSTEIGAEAELDASGAVDDRLTWGVNANALYPFVTTSEVDLEGSPLNVELTAKLGAKLTSWGSVEYVFTAKRVPLVLEEWQIQNGLLLNITINII